MPGKSDEEKAADKYLADHGTGRPARPAGDSLREAHRLARLVNALLVLAVAVEREQGTSWEDIAEVYGLTKSTAHSRFASDVKARTDSDPDRTAEQALEDGWAQIADLVDLRTRKAALQAEIEQISCLMEGGRSIPSSGPTQEPGQAAQRR